MGSLSPVKDIGTYRAATVPRWVYPARSVPGARPKRRLNARLKELSDRLAELPMRKQTQQTLAHGLTREVDAIPTGLT